MLSLRFFQLSCRIRCTSGTSVQSRPAAQFQGRGIGADGPEDELGSPEKNEAAANAIAKIQEKLQGYEDGTSGEQQSVEGQVQLLINSAKDPDNLCDMYAGWAPWM
jgi:phosphatidylinositol kinase/protein kinase (PI-3  family)